MFVHTVYFWLRRDLTPAERADFDRGVASLGTVPGTQHFWVGTPADTNRPVIDRTYDVGMTSVFADAAAQDAYQVHPIHLAFVQDHSAKWIRVAVYDHVTA